MNGIDDAAVDALQAEQIDWHFKGMPAAAFGRTVGEFLQQRPTLSGSGFVGPLLVLDETALEHNLRIMSEWCSQRGLFLAPHGKTTMSPQLFRRQLAHGAWGITAANVSQLRVCRAFGINRVMLANQLIDSNGLGWLAGELNRAPEFEFSCWVDSVRGVRMMTKALRQYRAARPVDVLVELGTDGARTGARTLEEALAVAQEVVDSPVLRLTGVSGYEGAMAQDFSDRDISVVDDYMRRLRALVGELDSRFENPGGVIVSAGGSSYFDQVAEALTGEWPTALPTIPVLRSGAYITHDDGLYRRMSPFSRHHRLAGTEPPFRPAMRIWAEVTSFPEPPSDDRAGLALVTMGRRDVGFDQEQPKPQVVRGDGGTLRGLSGCRVTKLADQHAFLAVTKQAGIRVGDWIGFGLSHPCTTLDKWPLIPVVVGDEIVDLVRTFF